MSKKSRRQVTSFIILLTLGALAVLFVRWRLQVKSEAPPPGQLALAWDTSTSVPRNCDALVATAQAGVNNLHIAEGSRFALITTGSSASRYEPVLALDIEIPRNKRNTFGGGKTRDEFFDKIKRACQEFGPADGSSIFRATEIAIAHVRSRGCASASDCQVIVSTDLEENINNAVRKRVFSGAAPAGAPVLLDSAGVNVTFCGYAQTTIPGGPRTDAQALIEGWKGLFSQPVTFRPYCDAAAVASTN